MHVCVSKLLTHASIRSCCTGPGGSAESTAAAQAGERALFSALFLLGSCWVPSGPYSKICCHWLFVVAEQVCPESSLSIARCVPLCHHQRRLRRAACSMHMRACIHYMRA